MLPLLLTSSPLGCPSSTLYSPPLLSCQCFFLHVCGLLNTCLDSKSRVLMILCRAFPEATNCCETGRVFALFSLCKHTHTKCFSILNSVFFIIVIVIIISILYSASWSSMAFIVLNSQDLLYDFTDVIGNQNWYWQSKCDKFL